MRFLMLWWFPSHKIIFVLPHKWNFATVMNLNINIWYATSVKGSFSPQRHLDCFRLLRIVVSLTIIAMVPSLSIPRKPSLSYSSYLRWCLRPAALVQPGNSVEMVCACTQINQEFRESSFSLNVEKSSIGV